MIYLIIILYCSCFKFSAFYQLVYNQFRFKIKKDNVKSSCLQSLQPSPFLINLFDYETFRKYCNSEKEIQSINQFNTLLGKPILNAMIMLCIQVVNVN